MANQISTADQEAIKKAVTEAIDNAIKNKAVTAGADKKRLDYLVIAVEGSAIEKATKAVAETKKAIDKQGGVGTDIAGIISSYVISPEMSLGEMSLQEFVNGEFTEGIAFLANNPYTN